ncbi:MAG: PKD domain-containing protein, partial [Acidobacteriota bacterium]|nr:PKD domain-containing protein [Acidobacteriota bacterium]
DITGTASDSGSPASGVAHVYVNGIEATFNQTDYTWALQDVPLAMGANEITVRAVDAAGNEKTTTISITREAPNQGPVVNAGADQTFALPQTASLHGAASDDGLPSGSTLSTNWSVVSNPGSVAFSSVNALETIAAFGSPGTYVLRLTASDGDLSTSDDITLTVQPENQPPTVGAGPNQTIALPRTATLNGTVTDDGLPAESTVNILWSQFSGPGTTTFEDPLLVETVASFSAPGIYVLRLTATDGELSASNEVTITVDPENQAPTADAGADQIISLPANAQLNGAASDDGWPAGSSLSVAWSTVTGPGTVAFANPNVTMTVASFGAPGTYVLRLTASDGELSGGDEIVVTVTPSNQAPAVSAETNQTITLPAAASLNGTITDDGLPLGSSVSASWSKVNGPGDVSFDDASEPATAAHFNAPGDYLLRLTASDGALTSSADVLITVIPQNHAPTANAGADQAIDLPNAASLDGSVSDDGLPAGSTLTTTWQKLSGPGEVTFASPHTTVTTAAFSAPGLYTLQLTASDSELIGADEVEITVSDPRVAPNADFVVPESTGTASSFLVASSGFTSSAFSADKILDNDITTRWTTSGITNQFATMQFFDQESVFIDRVRLQALNGVPGTATVKDFVVQVSATNANDSSFITVLTATLLNTGQLQEFVFPGGPARARFIKFLPKNNYGSPTNIQVATFTPVAVGSADSLISLPGQANSALDQSPALLANGAAVYSYSYSEGDAAPNSLLSYNGGWNPTVESNPFVVIQLAGGKPHTLDGIKMATQWNAGAGSTTAVRQFEVWVSATTPEEASFTKVLSATAVLTGRLQTFIFPGGPVPARYIKYVPLTNGGGSTINTESFDVIAQNAAQVVSASSQSQTGLSPAEAAFDSDTLSGWFSQSNTVTNVWVKTALADGATQKVYGVRVLPANDFTLGQRGPKDFDIRVSTTTTDDAAFTTVFSGTLSGTINGGIQEFLFPNLVDAKYVQFFWKNGYATSNIGVRSLEVLAVPQRGSAIVAFSSQQDPPTNALDLDPTNQWVTALNQPTNQWLKLVLPDANRLWTINHFALRASIVGGSWSAPKDFEFQVSITDAADSSFTTAFAGTLANSTQLQDFYFPAVQARYVRLLIKNNYGNGRLGLANFYIYAANQIGSTARFIDRSTDADGSIVNWAWNFGDGTSSNEQHPSHTFAQPGDYVVSLTVTDSSGLTNTRQVVYQVVESLRPDFSFSPVIAHEGGEAVRFTDTTRLLSDPNTTRRYDFGDGVTLTTSNGVSTHRYDDSGIFPATLKIGDQLGLALTTTKDITVLNMPPTVDIDPGKIIVWGEPWTSVPRINDQSPIDRLTLQGQWDFGDSQTSTCVNCTNANATVTHAYSSPGTYTAVLTIRDKDGGVGFDSAVFTVNKRPISLAFQNTPAAEVGQPALLRVRLIDSFANQPLAGRTIEFALNGAAASALTDDNGYAEVTVTFGAGLGSNIATAAVAEEDFYFGGSTYRVLQGAANQ